MHIRTFLCENQNLYRYTWVEVTDVHGAVKRYELAPGETKVLQGITYACAPAVTVTTTTFELPATG